MNVIIRLQNLPWSANASDIRQFFRGLQIPEGGVHIVGGDDGDAFIAFSTDEDARQAMSMNKMKLKETQVTLLLSSRAEMQKVIEKARAVSGFANKAALPTPEAITNQFVTKKIPQQAALVSNYVQMAPMISTAYQSSLTNGIPGLGGATNASSTMPMFFNPVDYIKLVNSNAINQQIQQQQHLSRDPRGQSRYHQRSDSRDRERLSRRDRSRSPYSSENEDKKEKRRRTRFSSPEKKNSVAAHNNSSVAAAVVSSRNPQMALIQQQQQLMQQQHQQVAYSTNQQLLTQQQQVQVQPITPAYSQQLQLPVTNKSMAKNGIWDIPPPVNLNSYASFNQKPQSIAAVQPTRNYQTVDSNYQTSSSSSTSAPVSLLGSIGTCVKIANVDKETTYGDIRKFFVGNAIGNNDIKFITDSKGDPSGVAVVRFLSSDSKKQALTKNGWQLKSTQIFISSITEEDYESGLEGAYKARAAAAAANNKRYEDTRRFRDRSDSRERDYDDKYNNNQGGIRNRSDNRSYGNFNNQRGSYQNGNNNRNNFRREDERRNNNQRDDFNRNESNDNQLETSKIDYKPDEDFKVLIIDDIPRVNENEIIEAFPTISSLTIERYTAHCKFNSHEDAKAVLENRFSHFINKKRVFVEKGSEEQFNDVMKKFGKFDNPSMKSINGDDQGSDEKQISRDPRQQMQRQAQNGNNFKTDCIMIKKMDKSATIEDVEVFLAETNIQKNQIRIHILLDKRGQPSGDCFVEFQFPDNIQSALTKNNQFIKTNRVEVMPIPREQVDAILNSFGSDPPLQQQQQQQSNYQPQNHRRDWGPPQDFGSPNCVVCLSNLSYRALTEEIIAAFTEFDLKPDQVIRRFNDNGQPTGMACINFNSPEDATKACDEYNKVLVQNRPVWLKRA